MLSQCCSQAQLCGGELVPRAMLCPRGWASAFATICGERQPCHHGSWHLHVATAHSNPRPGQASSQCTPSSPTGSQGTEKLRVQVPSPPPRNHIKVQVLVQVASLKQSRWHAPGASQHREHHQHNEVPEAPGMVRCWGAPLGPPGLSALTCDVAQTRSYGVPWHNSRTQSCSPSPGWGPPDMRAQAKDPLCQG